MRVIEKTGDLFFAGELAIGHGVNSFGVMGAGIAAGFRRRWPKMYNEYRRVCLEGALKPGGIWVYNAPEGRRVFNICTQEHPGPDARLEWIAQGMFNVAGFATFYDISQIAIPRIGCGIGGLQWGEVKKAIEDCGWPGFTAVVYSLEEDSG